MRGILVLLLFAAPVAGRVNVANCVSHEGNYRACVESGTFCNPNTGRAGLEAPGLPVALRIMICGGSCGESELAAGDVSGKGLKAAMMVSLILEGVRGIPDQRPGNVLDALNRADQLTFLSGGVREAAHSKDGLFGFHRTRALSTHSAAVVTVRGAAA